MFKASLARVNHGGIIFIARFYRLVVVKGTPWLDNGFHALAQPHINTVPEWKKGI